MPGWWDERAGTWARLIFAAGVVAFAAVMIGMTLGSAALRDGPPVPTDSYFYILIAEELRQCPLQDCPALEDLRAQAAAPIAGDAEAERERAVLMQRVFYMYHLAHAAALAGLHAIGVGWETAIEGLSLFGAAAMALGAALWLRALFGPAAAGIALLLLTVEVFPGYHGLHWIVPSNLALALALPLWAAVTARRPGTDRWLDLALPVVVLVVVWTHPVGRAYAGVALALYLFRMPWRGAGSRRCWAGLWVAGLMWASPMVAPLVVERPLLGGGDFVRPEGWDHLAAFRANARAAWEQLAARFGSPGGGAILVGAALGLMTVPRARRRVVWASAALLATVVVAALWHGLPSYPAELFRRVWVPVMMLLLGAFGAGAVWLVRGQGVARPILRLAAPAVGVALVVGGFGLSARDGVPALFETFARMAYGAVVPLDAELPKHVLKDLEPGARIAYRDELPLYFFLTHGGLAHGAVYARTVRGSGRLMYGDHLDARVTRVVASHPIQHGAVAMPAGAVIDLTFRRAIARDAVRLRLANPTSRESLIAVSGGSELRLPPKSDAWYGLEGVRADAIDRLSLRWQGGSRSARLTGLRLDPAAETHWPWRGGARLTYRPPPDAPPDFHGKPQRTESVRLALATLVSAPCRTDAVLEDAGALVVLAVRCGKAVGRPVDDLSKGGAERRR